MHEEAGPIPDFAAPVEAWRVWRVALGEGRVALRSLHAGVVWEPGVPLAASCAGGRRSRLAPWLQQPNDHPAPDLACECGIYGVRSLADARSYLVLPPLLSGDDRVIGRVALWGDVVEGPSGWRASLAYPLELLVPAPEVAHRGIHQRAHVDELLFALEVYGVPVDLVSPGALTPYAVRV